MWCLQILDKGMEDLELSTAIKWLLGMNPQGPLGEQQVPLLLSHRQSLEAQITICCQHLKISIVSEQYQFIFTVPQCENGSCEQSLVFQMGSIPIKISVYILYANIKFMSSKNQEIQTKSVLYYDACGP